jgi:hypothetical protein
MPWFVLFEARPQGNIGIFEKRGLSVSADSKDDALIQAREALKKRGFEVRFPVEVYQYQENDQ